MQRKEERSVGNPQYSRFEGALPCWAKAMLAAVPPSLLPPQIHEPILTLSGSEELAADCSAAYRELAAVGLPINIVIPYDDVPGKH